MIGTDAGRRERARFEQRLADERAAARVYRDLAEHRQGEERLVLLGLAQAEERHAGHWAALLGSGQQEAPRKAGLRTRVLGWLAARYGSIFVLALVQRAENNDDYKTDVAATDAMRADERIHAEVVAGLASRGRAHVSGPLRAGVFGANDGLVSNLALVLGMAGAGSARSVVLTAAVAGLLAGALSMAAGEYVSVRSQRELLASLRPAPGTGEIVHLLDVDANELALVYRARGMPPQQAESLAQQLLSDRSGQLRLPLEGGGDVVGSARGAALTSFLAFAVGASVPVLPLLVAPLGVAVPVAAVLVGLTLLLTGAVVGVLSGGPPLRRAVRQLLIGAAAALTTYTLGALLGVAVR